MRHRRGLSLVEVAVVMALIAVLMALSLPMLSQANAEARATACRQNLAGIGNAITGYIRDYGRLPHLAELPPHEPGMSLPELVTPRLQTPNVVFCPSDETDRSQVLGTSYHWATAYNGFELAGLDRAVDQPLVADREAFHTGSDLLANELVLRRDSGRYHFAVAGREANANPGDDLYGGSEGDEEEEEFLIAAPGRQQQQNNER